MEKLFWTIPRKVCLKAVQRKARNFEAKHVSIFLGVYDNVLFCGVFLTEIEPVAAAPPRERPPVPRALLPVLSPGDDVDVRARPKQVAGAPLQGLGNKSGVRGEMKVRDFGSFILPV